MFGNLANHQIAIIAARNRHQSLASGNACAFKSWAIEAAAVISRTAKIAAESREGFAVLIDHHDFVSAAFESLRQARTDAPTAYNHYFHGA
jgi:hypothetical protein